MTFIGKLWFSTQKVCLSIIRPVIGNRRYTKAYIGVLRRAGVDIAPYGTCGFIATSVLFDKYDFGRIHIGQDCYLTHDVILLVHDQSGVTAWNSEVDGELKDEGTIYAPRDIVIGDNAFIGMRSIVMPGADIGNDVVIGSGSVVKGKIPSGEVWAGNPARRICSTAEYRAKLLKRGILPTAEAQDKIGMTS